MKNSGIKAWAIDDRPREKLLMNGPAALSNSELLAILINNGSRDKSAVDLAKELLQQTNNDLQKLGSLSVKDLVKLKIKGIGKVKALAITAALELGIRREAATNKRIVITKSQDIANYLKSLLQYKKTEVFVVVFLNNSNKIQHHEIISEGGLTGTVADPRIIIKKALEHDAINIIICHNHPSGNIKPSHADKLLTQKIKEAAVFFDLRLLDHVIVGEEGYFSFADEGMI